MLSNVRVRIRLMEPIMKPTYFLTGFQGIGMVGYLVVHHLANSLPCRRVGFIEMPREPPYSAYVINPSLLSTPGEIYHCPGQGFTIAMVHWDGEFMSRYAHDYARAVASWVYLNGFSNVIVFGGLDNRLRDSDEAQLRVAVTTAYRDRYPLGNVKLMELNYAMVGPLALLMNEFERLGIPAISILPYAEPFRADPNAAIIAIKFLRELTGVDVDVSRLRELAEAIEREIQEIKESMKRSEGPPHYI
ncbi:proteasome assembly chaperone family protein [Vulcanisaeta thermophila]|uniref:proteasome assembly chaperone family protein n=1 Tax=Vulcanisaeta thermophila TaxID=867917 RepID=UPI000B0D35FA|nr:PAC2 family protein [Vulcanisaeta thermophila]